MNQISTRYVTEGEACYEQYVLSDPAAKTELVITPERGGMITGFTLDGDEYIWVRRPNFSECNRPRFAVPILFPSCSNPDGGVHIFDGRLKRNDYVTVQLAELLHDYKNFHLK